MRHEVFRYRDGRLALEGAFLDDIAQKLSPPFYVYGLSALVERYRALERAFSSVPHLHCVAMKANSQPALLRPLSNEGAGAEVVSGAELALALELGFPPSRIVFSGVGKTDSEIMAGLDAGIRMFLVESSTELSVMNELAGRAGKKAPVALRLNPDIDAETHPHIATGVSAAKFGVDPDDARELYRRHAELRNVEFVGIHSHIGSQITSIGPLSQNATMLAGWVAELRAMGLPIRFVDVGGGLGISYDGRVTPGFDEYARQVTAVLGGSDGVEIVTEPGRALFGPVGALVVSVLYVKRVHGRRFVIVDAGMNDLIRPALYAAHHDIVPLDEAAASSEPVDIAGAVCESSDVFARERALPELQRGDRLAILDAGAYGFAMSSNYNLRPRPAEVVVEGTEHRVVRARETTAMLVARELEGG